MARPKCNKKIEFCPEVKKFQPTGIPCSDMVIELSPEELEALRLKNILELCQTESAKKMRISQSTFQRILSSAYKKVSEALVNGATIVLSENVKSEK